MLIIGGLAITGGVIYVVAWMSWDTFKYFFCGYHIGTFLDRTAEESIK